MVGRAETAGGGAQAQAGEGRQLKLVRLAWADPHGYSRAKAVTVPAFLGALTDGYNINVATTTLDSAGARTFASFTRGGGMGLDEMTGSPNLTIVPDPGTFRVLPWAPGVGWVLCDEYFNERRAVPLLAAPPAAQAAARGSPSKDLRLVVGLEIEWYLLRVAEDHLTRRARRRARHARARRSGRRRSSPAITITPNPTWT